MQDAPAARRNTLARILEENTRCCSTPARISGWKMLPDIPVSDRAENGVRQGMEQRVSIGMPRQRMAMRNRDTTQHHLMPIRKGMDIKAETGAGEGGLAATKLGGRASQIGLLRDLEQIRVSGETADRSALGCNQAGIIGKIMTVSRRHFAMRRENGIEAEGLRRLDNPQARAIRIAGQDVISAKLRHRIRDG